MDKHPIDKAADVVGSQAALAGLLKVTRAAVSQWKDVGRRVPAEHCLVIERETRRRGEPVMCEELRPDMDWAVVRDHPELIGIEGAPPVEQPTIEAEG